MVGFSYGGAVALRYAADNPERVNRLVIVDSPLPLAGRLRASPGSTGRSSSQPARRAGSSVLPERQRASSTATGRRARPSRRRSTGSTRRPHCGRRCPANPTSTTTISRASRAPTLLVYGRAFVVRLFAGAPGARPPDARSVELDSGHFVPLEAPGALASALEEFLGGRSPCPRRALQRPAARHREPAARLPARARLRQPLQLVLHRRGAALPPVLAVLYDLRGHGPATSRRPATRSTTWPTTSRRSSTSSARSAGRSSSATASGASSH